MSSILKNMKNIYIYSDAFDIVEAIVNEQQCVTKENFKDIIQKRKNIEEIFLQSEQNKINMDKKSISEVNVNDLFYIKKKNIGLSCPKCKKFDTTYQQIQNRSSDEGMSALCVCRICKFQWIVKN